MRVDLEILRNLVKFNKNPGKVREIWKNIWVNLKLLYTTPQALDCVPSV